MSRTSQPSLFQARNWSMTRSLLHRSKWTFASGLALGLLVGVGMLVGA
jgi:hypothetical protein